MPNPTGRIERALLNAIGRHQLEHSHPETEREKALSRVARDAGVDHQTLRRFVGEDEADIRLSTIERLCDYLGLWLVPRQDVRPERYELLRRARRAREPSN